MNMSLGILDAMERMQSDLRELRPMQKSEGKQGLVLSGSAHYTPDDTAIESYVREPSVRAVGTSYWSGGQVAEYKTIIPPSAFLCQELRISNVKMGYGTPSGEHYGGEIRFKLYNGDTLLASSTYTPAGQSSGDSSQKIITLLGASTVIDTSKELRFELWVKANSGANGTTGISFYIGTVPTVDSEIVDWSQTQMTRNGVTSTYVCFYELSMETDTPAIPAVVTKVLAPTGIEKWGYIEAFGSGSVRCDIYDLDENLILADYNGSPPLSEVLPASQYPSIKLVWTLTNAVGELSTLSLPIITWEGQTVDYWARPLISTIGTTANHAAYTLLEVNGSGHLMALSNSTSTSRAVTIQVDGGQLLSYTLPGSQVLSGLYLRFTTSLKVNAAASSVHAFGLLD